MNNIKERPDYYLTPSRDFARYVKDCEEKYWNKETSFDWGQDVKKNLISHIESISYDELYKLSKVVLPMIKDSILSKRKQIKNGQFSYTEDALKDLAYCLDHDNSTIIRLLDLYSPLRAKLSQTRTLKDQLEIFQGEILDLKEQQRLGIIKIGIEARYISSPEERNVLNTEIDLRTSEMERVRKEYENIRAEYETELKILQEKVKEEQRKIESELLDELNRTDELLERVLRSSDLPHDVTELSRIKGLIVQRQLRALKDIANHALVVEQSAIAPLTMGIIHYKRYREIQEALTTFVNDEAKHSATFRRFLVEKLEAKEFVSSQLIEGARRYMWLARYAPGLGMFLAVIIEAIGASYLEFFSKEQFMPDKLFRSISTTISVHDETRHMDLCVDIYNELFRTGSNWERKRNMFAVKMIMKSVYGDKHDDHHLIQAFRSFGVEADVLYQHVLGRLSHQLTRVGIYVSPEKCLEYIGRTK